MNCALRLVYIFEPPWPRRFCGWLTGRLSCCLFSICEFFVGIFWYLDAKMHFFWYSNTETNSLSHFMILFGSPFVYRRLTEAQIFSEVDSQNWQWHRKEGNFRDFLNFKLNKIFNVKLNLNFKHIYREKEILEIYIIKQII